MNRFERGKNTKEVVGIGLKHMASSIFKKMNQKSPGTWTIIEVTKPGFIECWLHNTDRAAGLIYVGEARKKYPDQWDTGAYGPTKYPNYLIFFDNSRTSMFHKDEKTGLVTIEYWLDDKNFEI